MGLDAKFRGQHCNEVENSNGRSQDPVACRWELSCLLARVPGVCLGEVVSRLFCLLCFYPWN